MSPVQQRGGSPLPAEHMGALAEGQAGGDEDGPRSYLWVKTSKIGFVPTLTTIGTIVVRPARMAL